MLVCDSCVCLSCCLVVVGVVGTRTCTNVRPGPPLHLAPSMPVLLPSMIVVVVVVVVVVRVFVLGFII